MKLYSSMITLPVTNKGQQREITLKLGLQSTEAYFPYIAYMFFYYYVRSSVQLKIHAANIEASKFVCFLSVFFKLFLKISQMLVVCICYCYNFPLLLQRVE